MVLLSGIFVVDLCFRCKVGFLNLVIFSNFIVLCIEGIDCELNYLLGLERFIEGFWRKNFLLLKWDLNCLSVYKLSRNYGNWI